MADIEKVSRDLRYLISFGRVSKQSMVKEIAQDALELLESQQTIIDYLLKGKDYDNGFYDGYKKARREIEMHISRL